MATSAIALFGVLTSKAKGEPLPEGVAYGKDGGCVPPPLLQHRGVPLAARTPPQYREAVLMCDSSPPFPPRGPPVHVAICTRGHLYTWPTVHVANCTRGHLYTTVLAVKYPDIRVT